MGTQIVAPDISAISVAIVDRLRSWDALVDMAVPVERSERVPGDPSRTPWVGVYRVGVNYGDAPRVLGFGHGFRRYTASYAIVIQESDQSSGAECEDRVEKVIREVVGALLSDPSLGGTVDVLESFSVEYEFVPTNSGFFQQAVIKFSVVGTTGATTT